MEGMADTDAALAAAHAEYEAAMKGSAHTESDSSDTDDNDENGKQKARQRWRRRRKPHPGYFFPQLSQQRMVYCLDVLKREDIKSVSGSYTLLHRRKRFGQFSCSEGARVPLRSRASAKNAERGLQAALCLNGRSDLIASRSPLVAHERLQRALTTTNNLALLSLPVSAHGHDA